VVGAIVVSASFVGKIVMLPATVAGDAVIGDSFTGCCRGATHIVRLQLSGMMCWGYGFWKDCCCQIWSAAVVGAAFAGADVVGAAINGDAIVGADIIGAAAVSATL